MTPPQLRGRKNSLRDAFEGLSEMEAWILVHGSPHEVLATKILAEAKLPLPAGKTAVQTLSAYRLQAHDDAALTRLERAYHAVLGVPPAPAAPPSPTAAPPATRPVKAARQTRSRRE